MSFTDPAINPPGKSKINLTNAIAAAVALAAAFGVVIPPEYQALATQVVAIGAPLVTIVLRTFFTGRK